MKCSVCLDCLSYLPVSAFSIIWDTDLDCVVVVLYAVTLLHCNCRRQKFTIESKADIFCLKLRVQPIRSLPYHVSFLVIGCFICSHKDLFKASGQANNM